MSAQPARLLAFRVLREVEAGLRRRTRSATPDSLLARFESGASEADRALARELAFGVLRQRRALDHALDGFARRPLAGLDPALLVLLRMGLYQLRMLTRIPPHAAVHETVGLAREVARPGADRMVNAILRAYLRSDFPWPRPGGDPRLWLRVGLSHPDWMVDRFVAELGEAGAIARMEANNRVPRSFLRVSRRVEPAEAQERLLADGVRTRPFSMAPRCLAVQSGAPFRAAAHRDGLVHIQDAGSQLIAWLLPLAGAKRVLDACAAPGGKAGILAERLHPQRAVAADLRPHRVELLRRIAGRLGVENLSFVSADAGRPPFSAAALLRPDPAGRAVQRPRDARPQSRPEVELFSQAGLPARPDRTAAGPRGGRPAAPGGPPALFGLFARSRGDGRLGPGARGRPGRARNRSARSRASRIGLPLPGRGRRAADPPGGIGDRRLLRRAHAAPAGLEFAS